MKNHCSGQEGGLSSQIFFFFFLKKISGAQDIRTWTSFHRLFPKAECLEKSCHQDTAAALRSFCTRVSNITKNFLRNSEEKKKVSTLIFKRHHCWEQLPLSNHSFYTRQFKLPVITANQSVIIPHFSHSLLLL